MRKLGEAVGLVLGTFAVLLACYAYYGWALSWVWHWTAVPIFGLRGIGVAEAIGVVVLAGMVRPSHRTPREDEKSNFWVAVLLAPLLAMLVAWVAQHWY